MRPNTPLSFRVACGCAAVGAIEVPGGVPDGESRGACPVAGTGGWDKYKTIACQLKNTVEKLNICLVFRGRGGSGAGAGEFCRLDWFCFNRVP